MFTPLDFYKANNKHESKTMKDIVRNGILLILFAALLSCEQSEPDQTSVPVATQVDLILTNAKIITVDDNFSIQNTVAVDEGLIVATGGQSLLDEYQSELTVDLQGKTLMPGFIDSHTHIRGRPQRYIELGDVSSIAEIQGLIRAKAEELGEGEWITGYGWSEDELIEGRRPIRQDLDEAAPDNPITLTRAGGHSAVVSTLALTLAEITNSTPDPEGGVIERDQNGAATGIIRERQNIVGRLVPDSTYDELIASLEINLNALLGKGITSITDASKARDLPSSFSGSIPKRLPKLSHGWQVVPISSR